MGLKANADGSGAIQVGGSDAISITAALDTTFAGAVQASGVTTNLYPIVAGAVQTTTSGTAINFTSIPSWVKRITVMFSGVSVSGSSPINVQLGTSGGIQNTGYSGTGVGIGPGGGVAVSALSSGFQLCDNANSAAAATWRGSMTLSLLDSSTGIWACASNTARGDSATTGLCQGSKTLSGTLDRIRITTVNGTDTFDAGSVNILYE
jgi:hypothetical protein